jgi:hypothetical protein
MYWSVHMIKHTKTDDEHHHWHRQPRFSVPVVRERPRPPRRDQFSEERW